MLVFLDKIFSFCTRPLGLSVCAVIFVYRYFVSGLLGNNCRYIPSCSEYTSDAIIRHGLWAGFWMGMCRFVSCNPYGNYGFSPVPNELPEDACWWKPWKYYKRIS